MSLEQMIDIITEKGHRIAISQRLVVIKVKNKYFQKKRTDDLKSDIWGLIKEIK